MAGPAKLGMWSAVVPALVFSLVWLLGLTLVFTLISEGFIDRTLAKFRYPLLALLVIAFIVRLVPMILLPVGAGYDIESFQLVGKALVNGEEVYTSAARGRHPYLPLQVYVIGAATYLDLVTPIPFILWIKLPAVLADVLITGVIFTVIRRVQDLVTPAIFGALLYALNPISVMVSAYHGQFDAISVLLLLMAWSTWHFGAQIKKSASFLGFAILNKSWPIVFFPVAFIRLRSHRQRLIYTALAFGVPIVFTAAYVVSFGADPTPMLRRALTHSGVPGYWGASLIFYLIGKPFFNPEAYWPTALGIQRLLILLTGVCTLWWTRHQRALDATLTIILSIFAITLGIGIQWLLWPIAFAILALERRWLKWYTVAGAFMLFSHLYGLHLYPWGRELWGAEQANILLRLSSFPVWVITVAWAISRLRQVKNKTFDDQANHQEPDSAWSPTNLKT